MSGTAAIDDCCGLGGGTGTSSNNNRTWAASVGNRGSIKDVAFLAWHIKNLWNHNNSIILILYTLQNSMIYYHVYNYY